MVSFGDFAKVELTVPFYLMTRMLFESTRIYNLYLRNPHP